MAAADIILDGDTVTVNGHLVANIRVKWESLPQDALGGVFYLPPKDHETEVPLAVLIAHLVSLIMDTRAKIGATQAGWRWCQKCEGLFFAGHTAKGVCPAKGEHSTLDSGHYVMLHT